MSNKNKVQGTRKRRSFWQPESEALVTWLEQQGDLGTSLELIIVDAIHKYGAGDVIKTHLAGRLHDLDEFKSVRTKKPLHSVKVPVLNEGIGSKSKGIGSKSKESVSNEFDERDESTLETAQNIEKTTPKIDEPRQNQDGDNKKRDEIISEIQEIELAVKQESEQQVRPQDVPIEPEPIEPEDEYDPIAIMLKDVGSQID